MKSEIEIPRDRDQEVNFKKNENFRETRLSQVTERGYPYGVDMGQMT